jgi:hypothetical protein
MPAALIAEAIERLKAIGWLEVVTVDIATAPRCQASAAPSDVQPGSIGRKEGKKENNARTRGRYVDPSTITGTPTPSQLVSTMDPETRRRIDEARVFDGKAFHIEREETA